MQALTKRLGFRSLSVSLDCVLPGLQQLLIILLFAGDTSLVFDFGELCGALLVHAVLELAAHCPVALTYLAQYVSLVHLSIHRFFECPFLMHPLHLLDLIIDRPLIVAFLPQGFLLELLLQQNVGLSVLIDILHEVDAGLVLTAPLLLARIPLFLVLLHGELVDVPLVGLFVALDLLVVFLEFLDFASARHSLFIFELRNGSLVS